MSTRGSAFSYSTNRQEQSDTLAQSGASSDAEQLVEYNLFLTDAFGTPNAGRLTFVDTPGPSDTIDGFKNDDSYRDSRHFLTRGVNQITTGLATLGNAGLSNNLRENSLARQLEEKKDQPATIRLIRRRLPGEAVSADPLEPQVPWVNLIPPSTKFFLERVHENREEKVQVLDTFGEFVAFFFGRKPEVYSYSGTLLNAKNHDWKNEFQENYDNYLRGSQAVKYRATMMLQYDDVLVEGYMLNCQISMEAVADKSVPFAFNLLVLNRSPLNARSIPALRIARSGGTAAEQEVFNSLQSALDLTQPGRVNDLDTFLLMREYFAGNYVPSAGTATMLGDQGKALPDTNQAPGVVGGVTADKPTNQSFNPSTTTKLDAAGVLNSLGLATSFGI
jgi:hypothetical protein